MKIGKLATRGSQNSCVSVRAASNHSGQARKQKRKSQVPRPFLEWWTRQFQAPSDQRQRQQQERQQDMATGAGKEGRKEG